MTRRLFSVVLAAMMFVSLGQITLIGGQAQAVEPDEVLSDPVLESRARELSKNLRCLVCQNQTIDDSNADLARDLRLIVRERLVAGDSNDQVIDYVTGRYGDFVLLSPPFKMSTYSLWFGPLVLLVLGGIAVVFYFRRHKVGKDEETPEPLSAAEQKHLKQLLKEQDKSQ